MSTFNYRLLIPPEEEEVYPYRRVWQSIIIEMGILFAIAGICYVLFNRLNLSIPPVLTSALDIALALAPAALWLIFSRWREQFAVQPRKRLLAVAVITALVANAVSIPLIETVFQTSRWLPLASALDRIIGYTFTVGITQEVMKYLVVRYLAWPDFFRTRLDSVAYCAASAIGYATVMNLRVVASGAVLPDIVAMEIFGNTALNLAASIIIGYGLSEVRFGNASPFLAVFTMALAALLNGVVIPIRAGLMNAGFSLRGASANPLFGLVLSAVALIAVGAVTAFLFSNAERREREAAATREV